jgi:hypothetical protein
LQARQVVSDRLFPDEPRLEEAFIHLLSGQEEK